MATHLKKFYTNIEHKYKMALKTKKKDQIEKQKLRLKVKYVHWNVRKWWDNTEKVFKTHK